MTHKRWIYESSDGGITVTRRQLGSNKKEIVPSLLDIDISDVILIENVKKHIINNISLDDEIKNSDTNHLEDLFDGLPRNVDNSKLGIDIIEKVVKLK